MKKAAAPAPFPGYVPGRCCATVTRRAFGGFPERVQCHWRAAFDADGASLCRRHYLAWLAARGRGRA